MSTTIMVIQFFLSLSLLIVLHEFGHFLPAKWFKTRVEKFYLFFDPWFSLVKTRIGETEYGIGWLPLGGYVKISGMIDESMDKEQMKQPPQPWELRTKPAWQRLIIMLGGIIVNLLLGFFIFAMMLFAWGESYLPSDQVQGILVDSMGYELGLRDGDRILTIGDKAFDRFDPTLVPKAVAIGDAHTLTISRGGAQQVLDIDDKWTQVFTSAGFKGQSLFHAPLPVEIVQVSPKGPAEQAGLQVGDRIIGLNGDAVIDFTRFADALSGLRGQNIDLTIARNGTPQQISCKVTDRGTIGFVRAPEDNFYEMSRIDYGFFESFPAGVSEGMSFLRDQVKSFGRMFSGELNVTESLGGPIAIANMFPREWDAERFWRLTAFLSLILAFMNLLPIPGLDGGHVMFILWEMITGRKPSDKFMEIVTTVGFFILIGLMIFIFGNDIRRFLF